MNTYIINNPHWQSTPKRLGGFGLWLTCWAMWLYLLLPLFILTGWLLGDMALLTEMRWFGGYKNLLQLGEIYVLTLIVIATVWLVWVLYHHLRPQKLPHVAGHVVSDAALCQFYQINLSELQAARIATDVTVHFDALGQITQIVTQK